MSSQKIHNLSTLDKEIHRLKLRQKEIEDQLDKNVIGLKGNFGSMAFHTIIGSGIGSYLASSTGNFWGGLVGRIFQSTKLQTGLHKLIDGITEKVGDGIDSIASKIHP